MAGCIISRFPCSRTWATSSPTASGPSARRRHSFSTSGAWCATAGGSTTSTTSAFAGPGRPEPKQIPAGTRLRCTAVYDNSAANRANPDPSATVRAGTQSWDEMFNGYWDVVLADEDLILPLPWYVSLWSAIRDLFRPQSTGVLLAAGCLFLCRKRLRRLGARDFPNPGGPA